MIAIPAIAIYSILRRTASPRLVLEVGILSEGLMSRFENVGCQVEVAWSESRRPHEFRIPSRRLPNHAFLQNPARE